MVMKERNHHSFPISTSTYPDVLPLLTRPHDSIGMQHFCYRPFSALLVFRTTVSFVHAFFIPLAAFALSMSRSLRTNPHTAHAWTSQPLFEKRKCAPPPLRSLFYTASWPSQKQHWLEMEDGNVCLSWSLELSDSEKMLGDTYYDENTYATR